MNRTKIHYHKDKKDLIKSYYFALIPVLLFGIYKNGILLYQTELLNLKSIFIPIYFYIISIIIPIIISKITKTNYHENIILSLICVSSISVNTNIYIYPLLLFVLLFILNYLQDKLPNHLNKTAIVRLFLILSLFINSYSYLNIGEKLNKFNYNLFDIFIGHGLGGLANTSTLILLFSFIILSFNRFYKKIIPIMASLTYLVFSSILILITKDYSYLETIMCGYPYFAFIFIAGDIYSSPYDKKGMIIYGIIIGFFTSIFCLFIKYEGVYISIFLASILIHFINKITLKKYLHN